MLDRLSLSAFRNHQDSVLERTGRFNVLVGENGAGKTNILEAISLLAPGRGLRRAALVDMAAAGGAGGFAVGADLVTAGEVAARLGTSTQPDTPGRRRVRINGAEASATELGEWLAVSWLTPAMDGLFTGPAADRRRFLDRMALALHPRHAFHAARYEAALRERNRLLAGERAPDRAWLDGIEAQMAQHGDALMRGRALLVDTLMASIAAMPAVPFARPALTLLPGGPDQGEGLAQALYENRARDRAAQRTLTGPHRDELQVIHTAKRIPAAQSSTGEQKAMLVAIVLAHAGLAARGRPGVLLLDEIAAHLDSMRRGALFEQLALSGAQVWMTGTEAAPFSAILNDAVLWEVAGGTVTRV